MKLEELEEVRSTVSYLIDSGNFLDGETAYNCAMNSISTLDEAINYIRCSETLKIKNAPNFEAWKELRYYTVGTKQFECKLTKEYKFLKDLKKEYKEFLQNI